MILGYMILIQSYLPWGPGPDPIPTAWFKGWLVIEAIPFATPLPPQISHKHKHNLEVNLHEISFIFLLQICEKHG